MKRQGNCCSSTQDTSASQAALSTLDFPGVAIPTDVLKVIFSFLLDTKDNCRNSFSSWRKRETLNRIRWCCKTFKNVLPLPLDLLWVEFPHPDYSSIRKLTQHGLSCPDYFTTSQGTPYWVSVIRWLLCVPIFNGPLNKDLYLFIANGEHEIESYIGYPLKKNQKNKDGTVAVRNYLIIEIPILLSLVKVVNIVLSRVVCLPKINKFQLITKRRRKQEKKNIISTSLIASCVEMQRNNIIKLTFLYLWTDDRRQTKKLIDFYQLKHPKNLNQSHSKQPYLISIFDWYHQIDCRLWKHVDLYDDFADFLSVGTVHC